MKRVLKKIILSAATCFLLTFALIVINAIMGVFVGLDYYFTMACIFTLCMSIGLVLYDSKRIFSKKKRISSSVKKRNQGKKRQLQSQSKRKIS